MAALRVIVAFVLAVSCPVLAQQPNPPVWPASVSVFHPGDSNISAVVNAAFAENGGHQPANNGQFSSARFAFLFAPGSYDVDIPVGYYTHVVGLGESPDAVEFTGPKGVYCEEGDYYFSGGALDTFWRAAENFHTTSANNWQVGTGMMWAVSQAAPLRRVHVDNDLLLFEYVPPYGAAGYASGGYIGNSQVDGTVVAGSQQQFMARNTKMSTWSGGVWNIVFVGCEGAPGSHCSNAGGSPFTTVPTTPVVAEKPYITIDTTGRFNLNIPGVKTDSQGPEWSPAPTVVPFEQVYVARNSSDTSESINAALAAGLHVVLTPGVYTLMEPLKVNTEGQVVMGLGLATLIPGTGNPLIVVGNVDNVRIAGPLILQAGEKQSPALLQWGDGTYSGNSAKPGGLYDLFARVGGPDYVEVFAASMLRIDSGNVFGDNMWLWRADHSVTGPVMDSRNPVPNGLIVTGDNVNMYGLAVEHTTEDLVQWSGNNGATYFFQSELPYDGTQANFGTPGYCGYRVMDNVTAHQGYGVGVYTNFQAGAVTVDSGIVVPPSLVPSFTAPLGVFLNGKGTMNHIIDSFGNKTWYGNPKNNVAYVC